MPPLRTASHVDLDRYLGQWYEIARYPNRFQKTCAGSRATYTRRPDGKIQVVNECFDRDFRKLLRSVRGTAWVVDAQNPAKLKVSFIWPFSGDYWIIDLGENYEYAVVGHPKRKYLWILSREKTLATGLYREIIQRLPAQGYDPEKLITRETGGTNES